MFVTQDINLIYLMNRAIPMTIVLIKKINMFKKLFEKLKDC